MTTRFRRLSGVARVAACVLVAAVVVTAAVSQGAGPSPTPAAKPAEKPAAARMVQTGLPPELVIPLDKLDDEQKRLESLRTHLEAKAPPSGVGGFFHGVGQWFSGLFSGVKKPQPATIEIIVREAPAMSGQLVQVEGLYRKAGKKAYLIQGEHKLELTPFRDATKYEGLDEEEADGMPALATGNVVAQPESTSLSLQTLSPAPLLTLVRLARCYEARDDLADWTKAADLYKAASAQAAASKVPAAAIWGPFAMAHGGKVAEEKLRSAKKAVDLYRMAWDFQGRVASKKTPGTILPQTWVLVDKQWQAMPPREAIAEPLDKLSQVGWVGMWYRFVDIIVAIAGGSSGAGMILLAVVTRLLLYPLTKKQIQSAKAMQALQPQIKALQEKCGKDKQRFQEEFWKLCRANGVNPFGGCLPLVIQMPLLIMVYQGIRAYTVQLSQQGFLWIHNLADPDIPLLILYTISMVAFQKLTMKTQPIADPQQQQQQNMMVWMMPIMFFLFFQNIASGFILYWLGTNLIYLPQQYFGTRTKKGEQEVPGKERVVTLEPSRDPSPSEGGGPPAGPMGTLIDRVRNWISGEKPPEEPTTPASYEEKKREEKKRQRVPSRRRRRRL